jgi:hypothetical protein
MLALRWCFRYIALATLVVATAVAAAADRRLTPVDEAANDLTWLRFKTRLLGALEQRDQKALLAVVDSRIRNISGKNGAPEFRKLWQPHSMESPIWTELPRLLSLGGAFTKRDGGPMEFCAPYVHYKWPGSAPTNMDGAIVAKDVFLKSRPSASGSTQQILSYDLVTALDWEVADENRETAQKWVKIQTGQVSGFVPAEQIRSPLEHHACFVKKGASWRMTAFGVGE